MDFRRWVVTFPHKHFNDGSKSHLAKEFTFGSNYIRTVYGAAAAGSSSASGGGGGAPAAAYWDYEDLLSFIVVQGGDYENNEKSICADELPERQVTAKMVKSGHVKEVEEILSKVVLTSSCCPGSCLSKEVRRRR